MYYFKRWLFRKLFKILKLNPLSMPMVKYWLESDKVAAKVTTDENGITVMQMEGEDYAFPGFPRSHVLYGKLSKLKHEVKNQIFNESWAMLEKGQNPTAHIKAKLTKDLLPYFEPLRYDMLPPEKLAVPVRELWRVLSKMELKQPKLKFFKEYLCFLLQEDDSYRFRAQKFLELK